MNNKVLWSCSNFGIYNQDTAVLNLWQPFKNDRIFFFKTALYKKTRGGVATFFLLFTFDREWVKSFSLDPKIAHTIFWLNLNRNHICAVLAVLSNEEVVRNELLFLIHCFHRIFITTPPSTRHLWSWFQFITITTATWKTSFYQKIILSRHGWRYVTFLQIFLK